MNEQTVKEAIEELVWAAFDVGRRCADPNVPQPTVMREHYIIWSELRDLLYRLPEE